MVKVNELRVGNLFQSMGMIQTVFEILDNTDRGRIKQEGYENLIIPIENKNQYKPIEIHGIPLAENWLVEFNISKNNPNGYYVLNGNIYIGINPKDHLNYGQVYLLQTNETLLYVVTINYIHQLQNLYFALTGQELTRKEAIE